MATYPPEKAGVPGSQVLAHRGTSGMSARSDDAVPQDAADVPGLLLERLQAWKHCCGYLESYISATEKVQRAHAKEYEKVLKTISEPLREGYHFDQNLGGIAGLFENIRYNTQGLANSHLETEKNIKGSVLPILERLHTEIKNKSKELSSGAAKGAKSVDKARNATQKHIELLGQATAGYDSVGAKPEPHNDPYIIQRAVYHRLNKQILEENANRQDIIAVQNNFLRFEAHVVETLQAAIGSFVQFVGGQADRTKSMYQDILGTAQRVPPDFEWQGFLKRSGGILIDPDSPARSIDAIHFPNENHRATKPLIEGTLERKSRLLKSYSTGYYVVTPSKFLHEFKDNDYVRREPSPELSLYLPDCVVGAVAGPKFNVRGKDTSKGKVGGAFSTTHEVQFKAHTPEDAVKWHEVLVQCSGKSSSGETPLSPVSPAGSSVPSSPVLEKKPSPPAYQEGNGEASDAGAAAVADGQKPGAVDTAGGGANGKETAVSPVSPVAAAPPTGGNAPHAASHNPVAEKY